MTERLGYALLARAFLGPEATTVCFVRGRQVVHTNSILHDLIRFVGL
jgi:hypothetical protein